MKPPIVYYGGKVRMASWIVEVMEHYEFQRYLEPFGGSGAVLFSKPPSKCEIYNDIYDDLVNFYRVLRNPRQYKKLIRSIECTPYSREIYYDSRQALANKSISAIERARHFFVCARQSFSSIIGGSWSTPSEYSHTVAATSYFRAIARLPEVHERLKHVHIEQMDAIECIKKYANPNSLMFLDPPLPSRIPNIQVRDVTLGLLLLVPKALILAFSMMRKRIFFSW